MRIRQLTCMALLLGVLGSVVSRSRTAPPQERIAEPTAAASDLGRKLPDFTLTDAGGKTFRRSDLKEPQTVVFVFLSFDCPICQSYMQPLSELAESLKKEGVRFVGLTPNMDDSPAEVAKRAAEFKLSFPVYRDDKLAIAAALQARMTPEAFVFDKKGMLVYRGRIDDGYIARLQKAPFVGREDLKLALRESLAGQPVSMAVTEPVGCTIARADAAMMKPGSVTFHKDVEPILQKNCQTCHRPGEIGPFPLMTYRQAFQWADDIKMYTQSREMPPWKPSAGVAFHNDRRLSQQEINTLAAWADGGMPEGDEKDAPPPRKFIEGWQLGTPDLVLSVEDDFTLGATGKDLFRCFVLPTGLKEDKFVTAVEVRPGNTRVVHHMLLYHDNTGKAQSLLQQGQKSQKGLVDIGPGYTVSMGVGFTPQGGLGGWAPGMMPRFLPEKSAYYLPKNSDVLLQMHFHRNGKVEKERTQIGLYFAKEKVEKLNQAGVIQGGASGLLGALFFSIPPAMEAYKVQGDKWAVQDFTLYSVTPHMHMIGKSIDVTLTPPKGEPCTLIRIDKWDYNWQENYALKEPIQVKAGTRIHVDAVFDNSTKNPNNPFNPPQRITFGEQTTNEMCFVFLGGTSGRVGRGLPLAAKEPVEAKGK